VDEIVPKTATIESKTLFTKDGKYRFLLTRTWDNSLPKAVVIGINPSKATHLKGDNTVNNAMNFLIDNGYGEMTILNLFPYVDVNPGNLGERDKQYDAINDERLKEYCKKADMILVAWGYDKRKYIKKKKEFNKILLDYKDKVYCLRDSRNNGPCHLRIIDDTWQCVSYFKHLKNEN